MKTRDSTGPSTSGLVVMSPAPGTASVGSSLPSTTPREMSVQNSLPGSSAHSAPPSEAGETGRSAKSRGKKRAKEPGIEDELQSAPKRQKSVPLKPSNADAPDEVDASEDESKKQRLAPRPKPKAKKATITQTETATIPQPSTASSNRTHVEPAAASSEAANPVAPRRSARFAAGKVPSKS